MSAPLPHLELVKLDTPLDEALIVIGGREEETIYLDCPGAAELATRLVEIVNAHALVVQTLTAAAHALRSYEFGNASPELARSIAAECEALKHQVAA